MGSLRKAQGSLGRYERYFSFSGLEDKEVTMQIREAQLQGIQDVQLSWFSPLPGSLLFHL